MTINKQIEEWANLICEQSEYDFKKYSEENKEKIFGYHVSNVSPEIIKKEGFKAGLGKGATANNLFEDLYDVEYPKNYLFISKEPWDINRSEKYKYCYKIDLSKMDFYPDFGMLNYYGAYHEEGDEEEGQIFWWKDKDLDFMKNKDLKEFLKKQGGQLTVNEMMGGETVEGKYFPEALYDALGSAVIDGDIVNKENRVVGVEERALEESTQIEEGAIQNVMLATLLSVPGFLPAKTVQKSLETQPSYSYIINDLNAQCKKIGQYTSFQAANIIARTLFAEARNDGEKGMRAVASVIFNRAEGKIEDFANVCKKHAYSKKAGRDIYQFSCWNKMTDAEWQPANFKVKLPKSIQIGKSEQKQWEIAMQITSEMLSRNFTPTLEANMYFSDKTAKPSWGSKLSKVQYVGSHKFGILKNHSPFI